jgi:hypothetical protein
MSDYQTLKAAAPTPEELERRVLDEMRELNDAGAGMRLELHPAAAFAIVAFCQLALRHPRAAEFESAANVTRFIEYVRAKFEPHAPAIALAIERGNSPEHDRTRQAPPEPFVRVIEQEAKVEDGEISIRFRPNEPYRDLTPAPAGPIARPEPPEMEEERALLRRLLNSRDPLENARLVFRHEKHRMIFRRIMDLHERGEPVERVALANELMKNGELQAVGGLTYLVTLYEPAPPEPPRQATRDPRDGFLNCPYCGFSQPAPFEKVDLYICANCGRTVDGGPPL